MTDVVEQNNYPNVLNTCVTTRGTQHDTATDIA